MSEHPGASGTCSGGHDSDRHLGCAQVIAQIWTLLDGECQPDERQILQSHLDNCPGCLQHYGIEERIKELISIKCSGEKAPEGLRERLRIQISRTTIVQGEF